MARQYLFGTGNLYLIPLLTVTAPVLVGALQDVSVEFSGDRKMLHGQNAFPLDTSRGKVNIEGKASFGEVNLGVYNEMFFGGTIATGEALAAYNEAATIPATPFQVTPANAATFKQDLGVIFALTGIPLRKVAASPAAGQYSVNPVSGVYTFNTGDSAKGVLISYLYNSASTGQTLTVNNTLMGDIPTFQLVLSNKSKGKTTTLTLLSCTSSKLSFPLKQDDYGIADIDFAAQDDGTGRVMTWSVTGAT